MKKLISIFISIILVLSVFTGCVKNKAVDEQSTTNNTENTTSSNETSKEEKSENTETSVK